MLLSDQPDTPFYVRQCYEQWLDFYRCHNGQLRVWLARGWSVSVYETLPSLLQDSNVRPATLADFRRVLVQHPTSRLALLQVCPPEWQATLDRKEPHAAN